MAKKIDYFFGKPFEIHPYSIEEISEYRAFILNAPTTYRESKKEEWDGLLITLVRRYLFKAEKMVFDESRGGEDGYLNTFFEDDLEFHFAGLLLKDGLLPLPVCKAYVQAVEYAIGFLEEKKINCPELYLFPHKRGRKENKLKFKRIKEVHQAINTGLSLTDAYGKVAEKYFVCSDTIRREFERLGDQIDADGNSTIRVVVTPKEDYTSVSRSELNDDGEIKI